MMPPTSIDGTDITGATIDGQDVEEITVDGQTVFSAGSGVTQQAEHIWFMDEGTGSTVADSKGSADGTITGATWVTNSEGKGGAYLSFDNTDDIVETGSIFDSQTAFSAIAWVLPQDQDDSYVFTQQVAEFLLNYAQPENSYLGFVGGDAIPGGDRTFEPDFGNWELVGLTYSGGTANLYRESSNKGFDSASWSASDPNWSSASFAFGNRPDLNRSWPGNIDYGVVSFQEVTESDFREHYSNTKELYE